MVDPFGIEVPPVELEILLVMLQLSFLSCPPVGGRTCFFPGVGVAGEFSTIAYAVS